jgi:hypothetical protein
LGAIDNLSKLSNEAREPFFAFAHITCPHAPFVFDQEGKKPKQIDTAYFKL